MNEQHAEELLIDVSFEFDEVAAKSVSSSI
jgi:hypothetical protein